MSRWLSELGIQFGLLSGLIYAHVLFVSMIMATICRVPRTHSSMISVMIAFDEVNNRLNSPEAQSIGVL